MPIYLTETLHMPIYLTETLHMPIYFDYIIWGTI